jgi:hypothetical protein
VAGRKPFLGNNKSGWRRHSLSIVTGGVLLAWTLLYVASDPETHWGAFFGNAIADWSGLLIVILATKFLYERGSKESRKLTGGNKLHGFIREHSLSLFFVVTGIGWLLLYVHLKPTARWGEVVGNVLSEWTQILGVVLLTKKFFEVHSKE